MKNSCVVSEGKAVCILKTGGIFVVILSRCIYVTLYNSNIILNIDFNLWAIVHVDWGTAALVHF